MALDASAYGRLLKQLLPRGSAWLLEADSKISQTLLALGDSLARLEARGQELIDESDPRTASETLEQWEEMLGLPDEFVTSIPTTDAERRLAITQKLLRQGGQHLGFYVALAAACGYTVTITDDYGSTIFRTGRGRCGDRLYGAGWAYVWKVTADAPTGAALSHDELEAIITRAAPAHTQVIFEYL